MAPPAPPAPPASPTAAATPRTRARDISDSLRPIKPNRFGFEQARHLLWRAGFGGTPEQIQTLASWGPEKAVDHLLNYESVPYEPVSLDAFDRNIIRPPTAQERLMAAQARRASDEETLARLRARRQEMERDDRQQMRRIQHWWLKRMIETPRPLEEKMTLFWHGHFATSYRTIENSYHMFKQNAMFRRHACGNFGDLLFQIIRDPAMLAYLDNNDSRRGRPNENLARELMELFSLGVGNYTEKDIKEGARALTGYTFEDDEFVFQERNHDDGVKTILGKSGRLDGDDFVRAILEHKRCAPFIVSKLYRALVMDYPTGDEQRDRVAKSVVRDLAATLLSSRYNLKPVLRRLLLSEHFYDPAVVGGQIKSPVELVVGAVRSLNTPVRDLSVLNDALALMGQNLFFPPSVAGWAGGRSWINTSTMFVRQNTLCFLLTGRKPSGYDALASEQRYDPTPLLAELARADPAAMSDPERIVGYILRFALAVDVPEGSGLRQELLSYVRSLGGRIDADVITAVLLLLTAAPEYQLC